MVRSDQQLIERMTLILHDWFANSNAQVNSQQLMLEQNSLFRSMAVGSFDELFLAVGDRLDLTGPFGVFTLREGYDSDLVLVGGGAGMAPILSLLRSMAEKGIERKATYYYGARGRRDLCFEEELRALETALPGFRYVPALSEPAADDGWDGEVGLITDVVKRHEAGLKGAHAYVCGPPPMVEAAMPLLGTLGVEEKRIYYDKFTTTGDPDEE